MRWLYRKNGTETTAYLFCPDKSHKTAVQRNKSKRFLRELVRAESGSVPSGFDIAILVRQDFAKLSREERRDMFLTLVRQFP